MWRVLTVQIRKDIYYLLICCRVFPADQKICPKEIRGTDDQRYVDQHLPKYVRNVVMAWIDYKSPMIWSRILGSLKINKKSDKCINFTQKTMETWKVESAAGKKS